jgi:hypothetical protein
LVAEGWVGGAVYPEPKLVIVIAVTKPPTTVAKPSAVTPDVGGVKATLGTDRYPVPPDDKVTVTTLGPPIIGVATAVVVKVAPLKLIVGGDVYPEPK